MVPETSELPADLVLEGGGVKGIALLGAVQRLMAGGYRFRRVAGSSAGAIVGALVAAGLPVERMPRFCKPLTTARFSIGACLIGCPLPARRCRCCWRTECTRATTSGSGRATS